MRPPPPTSTLFPYTTLFRSSLAEHDRQLVQRAFAHQFQRGLAGGGTGARRRVRSEEHTSELQSQSNLVCRLLLEKKKTAPRPGSLIRPSTRAGTQREHSRME